MTSIGQKYHIPVAVIIPCYRSGKTIQRALDSVLSQSYIPAQIILVDDASDDDSLRILQSLQSKYPFANIQVDSLTINKGPGIARNRGWELASEPWLAFLDADDAWHHNKLEVAWGWIKLNPNTVLLGHLTKQAINENELISSAPTGIICSERISFSKMLISNRFYTRAVMVRRDIPFRFRDRQYAEDYLLWLEIVLSGMSACVLNQALAFSFRPEFSAGGYSGQLWTHEKRELRSWRYLYLINKISFLTLCFAIFWSYVKYLRRVLKGFMR